MELIYERSLKNNYSNQINIIENENLFECIFIVGLKEEWNNVPKPFIKKKFPIHAELPDGIETFCFPDLSNWSEPCVGCEVLNVGTYCLVLTDMDGNRRFGYCRRVSIEDNDESYLARFEIPLAYCIITKHRAYNLFSQILEEIETRHNGLDEEDLDKTFSNLYHQPFPSVNDSVYFSYNLSEISGEGSILKKIRRPLDSTFKIDQDLAGLFNKINDIDILISTFTHLLYEDKVILISNDIGILSRSIDALESLLNPFNWQNTLIPVLPPELIRLVQAPTPYLIGLIRQNPLNSSSSMDAMLNFNELIDEGIVIDIDDSNPKTKILFRRMNPAHKIPESLILQLESKLNLVDMFRDNEENNSPVQNILISESFTKFFLECIGDLSPFLSFRNNDVRFQCDKFLIKKSAMNKDFKSFLNHFTQTAMFNHYIRTKLKNFHHEDSVDGYEIRARSINSPKYDGIESEDQVDSGESSPPPHQPIFYKRKIPVWLEKIPEKNSANLPDYGVMKMLIDGTATMAKILGLLRYRLSLDPEEGLYLLINYPKSEIPPLSTPIQELFNKYSSKTGGVLKIYYGSENYFG